MAAKKKSKTSKMKNTSKGLAHEIKVRSSKAAKNVKKKMEDWM